MIEAHGQRSDGFLVACLFPGTLLVPMSMSHLLDAFAVSFAHEVRVHLSRQFPGNCLRSFHARKKPSDGR